MTLKQIGSAAGAAGALLLVAGGIAYLVRPALQAWLVAVLLLGAVLLLFAAYVHLDAIGTRLARRQTKYGLNVLAMVVLLLLIIVLVEYFSLRYNKRVDLTQGRRYTLSAQTLKILKDLKVPVKAVAFYRAPGGQVLEDRRAAEDLLRQYADLSPQFRYEFVDPDRDPGMARRYKITMYGTLILETPEEGPAPAGAAPAAQARAGTAAPAKAERPGGSAGVAPQAAAKAAQGPAAKKAGLAPAVAETAMREEQVTDLSEERLTNTLLKLTRHGRRIIYFIQGHGEGNLTDAGRTGFGLLRQEVEKGNYGVKDLFLPREQAVPEDAAEVVLLGPQKDLAEAELAILDAYLARGGKLLVMVDPFTAPGLQPFLAKFGMKLGDDVVVDRLQHMFGGNLLSPVVDRYPNHPITRGLAGTASVFSYVRSVDAAQKPPEGIAVEKLVESGAFPGSWAETDRSEFTRGQIAYDEGRDRKGPVPMAAVATIQQKMAAASPAAPAKTGEGKKKDEAAERREAKGRLVVYGGSSFASNVYLGAFGNRDLVMNTISWLAEEEDLLAIRPREPKSAPLFLTAAQGRLFLVIPVVVMPLAVACVGVGVFVRRRRYR